jgi:serine/threonine-protein kinase
MEARGRLLAGRYQLGRALGASAIGQVVKAYDRSTGRSVAVRLAHPQLAADPEARSRFLHAAREATRLDHPNIVPVLDLGEDRGMPYVVTELVEGRTLREALRTGGVPQVERAVEIAAQVCSALGAAHAQGLAHGGLTPGNVLGGSYSPVRVTDFGLAALAPASAPEVVPYRSPEQVQRGRVDDRSDLYALGCCLFELLTGEPPFDGPTPFAVMRQHISEPPRPPSALRPEVPAELDELVLRSLAKYPHERPQTAAEVRHVLARLRRRAPAAPVDAEPAAPVDAEPAAGPAEAEPAAGPVEAAKAAPSGPATAAPDLVEAAAPDGPAVAAAKPAEAAAPAERTADNAEGGSAEATAPVGPWTVAPQAGGGQEAAASPASADLPPHEERVQALTRFAEPPKRGKRLAVVTLAVGLAILVVAIIGLVAPGLVVDVGPGAASDTTAGPPAATPAPARTVPELTGVARAEAARRLRAVGVTVGPTRLARNTSLPKGLVVDTDPPAGATLKQGQAVELAVSNGSDPVTVGDLVGVIDEGPPSHIGPLGPAFRARLVKLGTLPDERRQAEIADLLRTARAGGGNGDLTPDFSRKAVEVLSRTD